MPQQLKFSRVIAGVMTWGSWGKKLGAKEMAGLMNHCVDIGLTTFDHADIYGGYTTEADFGTAFAQSGIAREDIQLISKCGIQYVTEARDNRIKHYNYASDYIVWSVEESLKNLKTDYLDLLLLHRPSPLMDPHIIAEAIFKLTKEGKIREFGVSNFTSSQIALVETALPIAANQVEFSLTQEGVMYDGTLDDCLAHGRTAMAWSPLGSFYRENSEKEVRIREIIDGLTDKYQASANQLLLAWIMKHPAGVHPVVGTTQPNRLLESMYAAQIELELEDWFFLLKASQGHKVP